MKPVILTLSILLSATPIVAQSSGDYGRQRPAMAHQPENLLQNIDEEILKPYREKEYKNILYREAQFNMDSTGKSALVIYLHGMHGRGSDNLTQMRQQGIYRIGDYILSSGMKALFVIPQCPSAYSWAGNRETSPYVHNIVPLIKKLIKEEGIDPSRIYLTGASAGGGGIWRLISQNRNMFAAALVASGRAREVYASDFKDVPIYMTVGSDEEPPIGRIVSWAQELKDEGCIVEFDILDGLEHGDACVQAFTPERLEWVFSHTLKNDGRTDSKRP